MPQMYDMGPTALLPLRRKACWGFFRPKNPTTSPGFEPSNLGTKSQHATSRPPKHMCRKTDDSNYDIPGLHLITTRTPKRQTSRPVSWRHLVLMYVWWSAVFRFMYIVFPPSALMQVQFSLRSQGHSNCLTLTSI